MKCAVLGGGPKALLVAGLFDEMGASTTLFSNGEPLKNFEYYVSHFGDEVVGDIAGPDGRSWDLSSAKKAFEAAKKIQENLEQSRFSSIDQNPVTRVQKCFYNKIELPKEGTRLKDMFRVVTLVDPNPAIQESKELSPEAFSNLSKEVLKDLENMHENFRDYDLVVDARSKYELEGFLSFSSAPCLNERFSMKRANAIVGAPSQEKLEQILSSSKSVTIVGDNSLTAQWLVLLESWLADGGKLNIVCSDESPFSNFKKLASDSPVKKGLDSFFLKQQELWTSEVEKFESEMRVFRDSDDPVVKRKGPPAQPQVNVQLFNHYNPSALDFLTDQSRFYLSVEKRFDCENPDLPSIQTVESDSIINANTLQEELSRDIFKSLRVGETEGPVTSEPGLYILSRSEHVTQCLKSGLADIILVWEDITRFFSRK